MKSNPGEVASGFFRTDFPIHSIAPLLMMGINVEAYLAAPIMFLFWGIGYAWKRTLPRKASEIDLDVRTSLTKFSHQLLDLF